MANSKEYNQKYAKDYREWCKKLKHCYFCGKQDAYTLAGRSLCSECAEKCRIRSRNYKKNNKEKISIERKEKYYEKKENNICPGCGKRVAAKDHVYCEYCLAKQKMYYYKNHKKNYSREEAAKKGLCAKCLKKERKTGYKVCDTCYNQILNASRLADHSYWKKSNSLFFMKEKAVNND